VQVSATAVTAQSLYTGKSLRAGTGNTATAQSLYTIRPGTSNSSDGSVVTATWVQFSNRPI